MAPIKKKRRPNLPGLQYQTVNVALARGLSQRDDDRARQSTALDIARDVQFDEDGGVQTRFPYLGSSPPFPDFSIFGGGSLANVRRIVTNGDELVLFTKDKLYSWNPTQSAWVLRGTHLAVTVDETPRFSTTGDQIDGDRAELAGTVVYAWTEGTQVYAAALDKATGSVLVSPTAVSTAIGRPRLVALATKILFFVEATTTLLTVRAIDPAAPGTAISGAGTTVLATNFNLFYDVVRAGTQDLVVGACRRVTTTSYTVFTVTPALVVTTATPGRTADGPLAVSCIPDGTKIQVVRANGTNIQGDFITTATLADVTTGQAIGTASGTPVNQIAACHRSVAGGGGAFKCFVFWSAEESASTSTWVSKFNFVDSAGTIGTQANFVRHLGVASRAFDYNGEVYVWLTFGGAATFSGSSSASFSNVTLQNTYFLYRDDATLHAKSVATKGGGFAPTTGRLPHVALTSGTTIHSWCATTRRRFEAGGNEHVDFAARAPVDVVFEFDADEARRTARIGATMYITGGEVLQYDGARLVEAGFHIYPWVFGLIDAGGGSIGVGDYAYKLTYRYQNAAQEIERSTTATVGSVTVTGSSTSIPSPIAPLTATRKLTVVPAVEVWRTLEGPVADSDFYLVSSNDPTVLSGANRYLPNDPTAASLPTFNDFLADATVGAREANPENGAVLESLAPPGANIIIATDTRLFLGDVTGDPDRVWYSRLRASNEVAAFHDTLTFNVPRGGGRITSLFFDNEILYVARETAIYAFGGAGKDNLGQGQNFQLLHTVSSDVGCVSHEAHALTPAGTLLKSSKGWHLLRGGTVEYIGAAVSDFDTDTVLRIDVIQTRHHVRILTSSRIILWAYPRADFPGVGQFGEWTAANGTFHDSAIYRGAHVLLVDLGSSVQGIVTQSETYTSLTYGLDVETAWIKPGDVQQGADTVRKLQPLGEVRSPCFVRARIAYNYNQRPDGDAIYTDDKVFDARAVFSPSTLQFAISPSRPKCDAIKLRLTAVAEGSSATIQTLSSSDEGFFSGDVFGLDAADAPHLWDATFNVYTTDNAALVGAIPMIGEIGNRVTMSIGFDVNDADADTVTALVDVRDHFKYNPTTGAWTPLVNNIGVRVFAPVTTPTAAELGLLLLSDLAAAIQNGTKLAQVQLTDPEPGAAVDMANMDGALVTGQFTNGAFASPTGEGIKLTSLGIEVGVEPGLFRQLTAAQHI